MNQLKAILSGLVDGYKARKTGILNIVAALTVGALYLTAIGLVITAVVAFVDIFLAVTLFNSPFWTFVLCLLGALAAFFSALAIVFFRGRAAMRARRKSFGNDPFGGLRF